MKAYLALALAVVLPVGVQAQPQGQMEPNHGQMFLRQFDKNGDGFVSKDEFVQPQAQMIEQQFKHMDKSGDGFVNADEANAFAKEMQQRAEQMRQQMQQQQQQQGGGSYR